MPHGELTVKNGSIPPRNKEEEEAIWRSVTDRHPDVDRRGDQQTLLKTAGGGNDKKLNVGRERTLDW